MVEKIIIEIEQEMINVLNNMQMEELHKSLLKKLGGLILIDESNSKISESEEVDYCNIFICAKRVEGCSEKSIKYYKSTIEKYFRSNEIMISQFMECTHWCEFYFDNDKKVQKIVTKYEKILKQVQEGKAVRYTVGDSEFEYTNEDKVNDDMNNELEELQNKMEALKSNAQRPEVYSWISNIMNLR